MPVPDYQTLMLPVLKLFAAGRTSVAECVEDLKAEFDISDEEAAERLPSGKMTRLYNRVHWARTYLGKAGLLKSPERGRHEITELGKTVLANNPLKIDNTDLKRFDGFSDWKDQASSRESLSQDLASQNQNSSDQTPEDAMASAHQLLNSALRDELLDALLQVSPQRFERLILDLLAAMKFGGGAIESGRLTPVSGDGGIDGIIEEDALGLDAVYIQAKRYAADNKVGRPDIQRFVGSLTGESATKGVFVTTSSFSKEARDYIGKVQQRIVLIDGTKLA